MTAAAALPAGHAPFQQSWKACALVIFLSGAVALAIQLGNYLHQDVAFLTWTADQVMRGAVFGRDIYDINAPLSFLVYVPAALLGRLIGFDLAIKLWMVAVAALSIACVWQTAERSIRLPVIVALGAFFALTFQDEFGQREQLTLLLCAPYVAGNSPRRGLAITSGLMAAVGFALKPYFLVALVLVFATRRRLRAEEWTIALAGACYAASLVLLFQPFLTEMLPKTIAYYWMHNIPMISILQIIAIVPIMLATMYVIAAPQRGTAGYAMAVIGFAIAVILHRKGYFYHYIPCFGFLALYLAAHLRNERRMARLVAVLFLALEAFLLVLFGYFSHYKLEQRSQIVPALLQEVDKSKSFTFLSNDNFGSFPTAILTDRPFLGLSPLNNFISAVADYETGAAPGEARDDAQAVARLALDQAIRELERKPDLVIVATNWSFRAHIEAPFDGLAWFNRDPTFHALWQDYALAGQFREYQFYRRK